jgi:hypothetical protein
MKKYVLSLLLLVVGGVILNAAVLDKKTIKNVSKVALVSVTSTKRILYSNYQEAAYVYKDPAQDPTETDGKKWGPVEQPESDLQLLYDFVFQTFQARLAEIPNWELVSFETIRENPAYQAFQAQEKKSPQVVEAKPTPEMPKWMKKLGVKIEEEPAAAEAQKDLRYEDSYRAAANMKIIPVEFVTDGVKRWGNQDPYKGPKDKMAQLARDLNVDGVILVQTRPSYRYGKAAALQVGGDVKGIPRFGASMVMISNEGKIVAEVDRVTNMVNEDFEGDSITIAQNGRLALNIPKTRTQFEESIVKSADKLKKILENAYSKLK